MRNKSFLIIMVLAAMPCVLNCECGDTRVGVDEALVGRFFLGNGPELQSLDMYGEVNEGAAGEGLVSIEFGRVDLAVQANKYLFLRNVGTSPLNIVGVDWQDGADPAFSLACQVSGSFAPCTFSDADYMAVAPGADLLIEVSFLPQEERAYTSDFVVRSNAGDFSTVHVALSGQGVTPEVQVCITDCLGGEEGTTCQAGSELCNDTVTPNNLLVEFGDLEAGLSLSRIVVVNNIGEQDLQVSTIQVQTGDASQFAWAMENGTLPGNLAPGASATIAVTYTPSLGGEHASTLQIISNDVNENEIHVELTGRSLAPRVCVDPFELSYGYVAVGDPVTQSFELANCGLMDLEIENIAMGTDVSYSQDFDLLNLPGMSVVIEPGNSIQVEVQFDPTVVGPAQNRVEIFSNDPVSNPETHLTGSVAVSAAGFERVCQIQVSPPAVNFGGVVQNAADPDQDKLVVRLINAGNDDCTFDSAEITVNTVDNEFSVLLQPGQTTFAPGDVIELELMYAPVNLGLDTGTLTIHSNDNDEPAKDVALNGEGVSEAACVMEVNPTWLHFGTTKLNTTRPLYITLQNLGNADCTVFSYDLEHSILFPSDFEITAAPPAPINLRRAGRPGDRQEIEITFAPSSTDFHKATFRLETSDPTFNIPGFCFPPPEDGDACISVSGMAAESDIEVVPSEMDFGVVTVGCNSPEMRVTVYNLGGYDLDVSSIYLENMADPNFSILQAPATPFTLTGGSSFQVVMRYHPQDYNPHRNALYIESDASNEDLLVVPLFGLGTDTSTQTDVFHQPEQVRSDVLFVVDNSGSMGWAQNELADNFGQFISWALSRDVDYHIGVLSTEVNEPETDQGNPPRDILPGVLVHAPSRPPYITNQTPDFDQAFNENVHIGTCCSDEQEAGLEAAWMALSEPLISDPTANAGFLREDAKLYIICVSDEQDQSRGNPDFYVDFFSHIKGVRNRDMMKVSAIVGDAPDGCGGEAAVSGSRYIEVANRTGGLFQSICTSNWAMALESLGIDAFAFIREFPLTRPAEVGTIVVMVDGIPVPEAASSEGPEGWSYMADSNSVYFGDDVVPEKGSRIEVSYTAACLVRR
ncbi:MAG: choice-of-anchor D domain-containing protein [Deltaproteobacteria bacterium]|nr:choice-of-anchor D domain-containing protein [Deltaproteobacteria bacterium]